MQKRRLPGFNITNPVRNLVGLIFLFALMWTLSSCDREDFTDSPNAMIEFSVDTLMFDTVFTERGTITRYFKVYNRNDRAIRVKNARLENSDSFFRFNFDGFSQDDAGEVIIWPNDSTYVFVEATIDPDVSVSASPFVINDRMLFEVNGNTQDVRIKAFGQNANYIPANEATGGVALLSCGGGTVVWDDPKPYVIFGVLVIDDCTLVWPAGTRVHVHGGIASDGQIVYNDGLIFTGPNGRILSEGTVDNPVVVEGDRLEPGFAEIAGQWSGIRLGETSGPHRFEHTIIRNPIIGIRSDSATTVDLDAVTILNTTGPGLVGIHNSITATNCLIANNGGHSVQLSYGGDHNFYHTTLGNFGNQLEALRIDNFFCYDPPDCDNIGLNPLSVNFYNSIIGGNGRDEIRIIDVTNREPGFMNFSFDHCLVRVFDLLREQSYPEFFEENCINCINFELFNPLFADLQNNDYRLDSLSTAIGQGKPLPEVSLDIKGNPRDPDSPDVGCYEWIDN